MTREERNILNKAITLATDLAWGTCEDDEANWICDWAYSEPQEGAAMIHTPTGNKVVVVDSHGIWFECYIDNKPVGRIKDPVSVVTFLYYGIADIKDY